MKKKQLSSSKKINKEQKKVRVSHKDDTFFTRYYELFLRFFYGSLFFSSLKKMTFKKMIKISAYDLLFYGIFFLAFLGGGAILNAQAAKLPDLQVIETLPQSSAENVMQNLEVLIYMVFAIFVVLFLIFIVNWAITRCFIWNTYIRRDLEKRIFGKYILFSFLWFCIWIVLFVGILVMIEQQYLPFIAVVFFLLFLHLTPIVHILFTEEGLIGDAMRKGLYFGIVKIHHFLLPYLLMVLVYLIVFGLILFNIIYLILPLQVIVVLVIFLMTLMYLAWTRAYLVEIVEELYHKQ